MKIPGNLILVPSALIASLAAPQAAHAARVPVFVSAEPWILFINVGLLGLLVVLRFAGAPQWMSGALMLFLGLMLLLLLTLMD